MSVNDVIRELEEEGFGIHLLLKDLDRYKDKDIEDLPEDLREMLEDYDLPSLEVQASGADTP